MASVRPSWKESLTIEETRQPLCTESRCICHYQTRREETSEDFCCMAAAHQRGPYASGDLMPGTMLAYTPYWFNSSSPHLLCYLQNPNRISARDDFVDFQYLCQMLMTHEVDIFGLPESGLDWKQHTPPNKCRQIMYDFWDHTRLVTSTSNITCNSFTQFGGTCTGITDRQMVWKNFRTRYAGLPRIGTLKLCKNSWKE